MNLERSILFERCCGRGPAAAQRQLWRASRPNSAVWAFACQRLVVRV